MSKYTIRVLSPYSLINKNSSLVESILCNNLQWATAANGQAKFNSPQAAAQFAQEYKIVERRPKLGSECCPYIVGPNGGRYSIFTGKRIK